MNDMSAGQETPPVADQSNEGSAASASAPNRQPDATSPVLTLPSRLLASLAGMIAAGAALATGELFSGLFSSVRSLVVSVAEAMVDWTPGPIARWSIDLFGSYQKTLLVWGIAVISLLIGAAVGRASRVRSEVAMGVFALFAVVGGVTAARVPGNSAALSWLSALVAAGVGLAVLLLLLSRLRDSGIETSPPASLEAASEGRRTFLGLAAGASLASVASWMGGSFLRRRFGVSAARDQAAEAIASRSSVTAATATAVPPTAVPTAEAAVAGAETAAVETATAEAVSTAVAPTLAAFDDVVDGITPLIVANDDFYRIDTALIVPQVDPADWSMKIHGLVDNELEFTYQDLLDRANFEQSVTLSCVSNQVGGDLVGNAVWLGVPLNDLLAEAGVQPGATQLVSRSVDGWDCGFPPEILNDPGRVAMVAIAMNGEPLPVSHGFPARLVVSGLYGYVSATKWLKEIELTTWEDFDGYWIPRGWGKLGPVKTQSRVDVPRNGSRIALGEQTIAGVAWAPHLGIDKVEVAVDDGEWIEAELIIEQSVHSWRQWKLNWNATPGQHRIKVRATDSSGYTQTEERVSVAPDGATGHHTINVKVDG